MQDSIVIKGARVHNLRNIDLIIPRSKLVVITGPSGSGKSSIAFDTIYAEGQRRYMESLSAYTRQFLHELQKPDVDSIEGLSPSIALDQKVPSTSQRSTVGTITGLYDYLRVLYTRIGKPFCFQCGNAVKTQADKEMIDAIMYLPLNSKIQILSPIVTGRKGEYKKELDEIRRKGFIRARIDGTIVDLTEKIRLERYKRHYIEVVVDRLIIKPDIRKRLSEAIQLALKFSDFVIVNVLDEMRDIIFSKSLSCHHCGISYPEINARFFSFNSPYGACPRCKGTGTDILERVEAAVSSHDEMTSCAECGGYRLRKEALSVLIEGRHIGEISALSIEEALSFFYNLTLTDREREIGSRVIRSIHEQLGFMVKMGLTYLTINRVASTLSGGEAQRVRLATQLGASLTGVIYILDEPSIGLHPVDCEALLYSLQDLTDADNTVIVVEHDEETIRRADYIVDMGPGAGMKGGEIIAAGSIDEIMAHKESLTGAFLRRERTISVPERRRRPKEFIMIRGAQAHNLKSIDAAFPLGVFTCVTGVSGSGKSSLVFDILYKALSHKLEGSHNGGAPLYDRIEGIDKLDKVIHIDQRPLGRTPRSNPATYTGLFAIIRALFANLHESKVRGYKPGRFSFNISGGRCEVCKGDGVVKVAMHFLPDVYVPCEFCSGKRYNKETLEIRYKDKNIAEILDLTVSDALEFFNAIPMLRDKLLTLDRVGLGYLTLGQPATTLSGGEIQRLKLSKELSKKATGRTFYLMDEPTTGLHFIDIEKLLSIINELVEKGNSVVVIEHNLDVIKNADYIIDLGPGGGNKGGQIIASGKPEEIIANSECLIGKYLKDKLLAQTESPSFRLSA
jgi:excinuclease ABC subunit A